MVRDKKLFKYFTGKSPYYAEFGGGETTKLACRTCARVLTIESSPVWASKLTKENPKAEVMGWRWGVRAWGYPEAGKASSRTPDTVAYTRAVRDHKNAKKIRTVLVDGRYRVASALHTWFALNPNSILLVDDWNRGSYHILLKFYKLVRKGDRTVALRKDTSVPPPSVRLIRKYESIPN